MPLPDPLCRRFALHGLAVEVVCGVDGLVREVDRLLGDFEVPAFPPGFTPIAGTVRPYDVDAVTRSLSASARPVACPGGTKLFELYEDGERYWLVDERWGLAEVNLLKGQWKVWVLPRARIDAVRCAELALLWPLAQLLRAKGLHLLPAASVVRDGRGMAILSPVGLAPELAALIRSGYRVVGQRWTALREEDGRMAMLSLPGLVERPAPPPRRPAAAAGRQPPTPADATWADLTAEHLGAWQHHAFCDAVCVVLPGRRPTARLRAVSPADAVGVLRGAWPIVELHPNRRHGQLATRLAQSVPCYEAALSRDPSDFISLLSSLPHVPVRVAPPSGPTTVRMNIKPPRPMRLAV